MTGPAYPRPPGPGSNAIGKFQIGVSPIGDIVPAFYVWDTIISQYANSPILTQIIESWSAALDQTLNFESFYDNIWNIQTANGLGLDIWGRIVGVNRLVTLSQGRYFGFEEQSGTTDPFQVSPLYRGQAVTYNYALVDSGYRLLILAKAAANISNGSSQSINSILRNLFPFRGNCYVVDSGGMAMIYTFDFPLTAVEQAVVKQSGVLPKPTGVAATYVMQGNPF